MKNKNIGLKITVEFTCYNMIDEKTLAEDFNNDCFAAYKFISGDFTDSPANFSASEKIVKVEVVANGS